MNRIVRHFINRVVKDNRGIAWWIPTAISAGASLLGGAFGDKEEPSKTVTNTYQKLPDYAESDDARKRWSETLQGWNAENLYGAISPNWADIWTQAQNRVQDYFSGTATTPGVYDKIRASAARRNVSDSPALENQLLKANIEEGNAMANLATDLSTKQAEFGESARLNWLTGLSNLSQQKPTYQTSQSTTTTQSNAGIGDFLAPILGQAGSAFTEYLKNKNNLWGWAK